MTDELGFYTDSVINLLNGWREALGLSVEYEVDFDAYWEAVEEGSREIDFTVMSPLYPHPNAVLRRFNSVFGEQPSSSELRVIRSMMEDAAREPDAARRFQIYHQVEARIVDRALALPLFAIEDFTDIRVQPWVHDLHIPKYPGSMFKGVWMDDSAPERILPE